MGATTRGCPYEIVMDCFMKYNPDIHHRRSIRLKGYDYSRNGAYFITVCAQNRTCFFGNIKQGEMILNDAGKMAQDIWIEIPEYYDGIEINAFQIMPNHIHGIIIVGARARPHPHQENSHKKVALADVVPLF